MNEQPDIAPAETPDTSTSCGETRETLSKRVVTCTRLRGHSSDHFDDDAGWGWQNEQDLPPAVKDGTLERLLQGVAIQAGNVPEMDELGAYVEQLRDQLAQIARVIDGLGVPRERHEQTLTTVQRLNLFVDRLSRRLHDQVENNMIFYHTCKDALLLLEGAPSASQFRVKQAIETLRRVTRVEKKTASGIIVQ